MFLFQPPGLQYYGVRSHTTVPHHVFPIAATMQPTTITQVSSFLREMIFWTCFLFYLWKFLFSHTFLFRKRFFSKWNLVQNYEMTSFICNLYYLILYSSLSTNKQIHLFTINLNFLFNKHVGFQVFTVNIIESTEPKKGKRQNKKQSFIFMFPFLSFVYLTLLQSIKLYYQFKIN